MRYNSPRRDDQFLIPLVDLEDIDSTDEMLPVHPDGEFFFDEDAFFDEYFGFNEYRGFDEYPGFDEYFGDD